MTEFTFMDSREPSPPQLPGVPYEMWPRTTSPRDESGAFIPCLCPPWVKVLQVSTHDCWVGSWGGGGTAHWGIREALGQEARCNSQAQAGIVGLQLSGAEQSVRGLVHGSQTWVKSLQSREA